MPHLKIHTLYWKGVEIDRFSEAYQEFLDRAFDALSENEAFAKALLLTGDEKLKHSVGKMDEKETILTRREFSSRLTKIRERLKAERDEIVNNLIN